MLNPRIPTNESDRLKALEQLKLLNTPIEHGFDRVTRLAQKVFNIPMVAITLVDREKQWIKSSIGLEMTETSRDVSFCGHTILTDGVFIIEDTHSDVRFHDNPLVLNNPYVRFYAGCPIHATQEERIGAICIIDTKPRHLISDEITVLHDLALLIDAEIKNHTLSYGHEKFLQTLNKEKRHALIDPLTRLWNKEGIHRILTHQYTFSKNQNKIFGLITLSIDHFLDFNKKYSQEMISQVLQTVSHTIVDSCRDIDSVGRCSEEEFLIIIPAYSRQDIFFIAERMRKNLANEKIKTNKTTIRLTATLGLAFYDFKRHETVEQLIHESYNALVQGKHCGRNQVAIYGMM